MENSLFESIRPIPGDVIETVDLSMINTHTLSQRLTDAEVDDVVGSFTSVLS
jgi:hypothetical protein